MTTKTRMTTGACVMALAMAGCAGKVLYPRYYSMEIPRAPEQPSGNTPAGATLAVRRFETPSYLRQGRIVYRQTPREIGFYEYRRWAADPAAAVTEAVIDSLRSSRLFSFVKLYDGQGKQDYLMSGRIDRLEEIDYGGGVRVEARLSAELLNLQSGATVWTDNAAEARPVETRNIDSVVGEMSRSVRVVIDSLVSNLKRQAVVKKEAPE